ncbi:MAG TPA: ornithine carbamoyltransferase [Dehalococcoidia bacterium]|nr:ornithine carbamoyltransferase [Dehalococcoidia bacterium]
MKTKDLISVADLSTAETEGIIAKALEMKREVAPQSLSNKVLALIFEKPSLRTRVSFEVAIHQLGGYSLYLSSDEVGLGKREPVSDVAQVLSRYVDGIIARTFSHQTLQTLARYSSVPVINALSDLEHPCQALADMVTICEKKGRLRGLTLAFIGDGNNVAHSLLLAASLTGVNFHIASPLSYKVKQEILQTAEGFAARSGGRIILTEDPRQAAKDADIIYTDVWASMGQEAEAEQRRIAFAGYQVDIDLLSLAKKDVIFMHPMPAHHGEEVAVGLLDSPCSVVFDQAENRLHLQKALLAEMFLGVGRDGEQVVSFKSAS